MFELASEWFSFILDTMDEGIHVVDASGLTVVYNRAASRLDGLDEQDVVGKHILSMFPSLGEDSSTLLRVLKSGRSIYNQPQTYTNYKGIQVHTVNTTLPIYSGSRMIGALEIAKDMTQVKHLSDQVMDLHERMVSRRRGGQAEHRKSNGAKYTFESLVTNHSSMQDVLRRAMRAASSSSPILIYGETGTGKELLVQSIHNESPRRSAEFLALNCAALPASLLEGILFGTVRGSFTGAQDRPGLFELADGGSLFLDEIQSLPFELQAKLLRVLQEKEFYRVGDTRVRTTDVRVMAATNVEPELALEKGSLRPDLYYRLSVVRLDLPPLRDRRSDIPTLLQHFLTKWNRQLGTNVHTVNPQVLELFDRYPWPGNVRELENTLESVLNLTEHESIEMADLPKPLLDYALRNQQLPNNLPRHSENAENSALPANFSAEKLAQQQEEWVDKFRNAGVPEFWTTVSTKNSEVIPSFRALEESLEHILLSHAFIASDGNIQQCAMRLGLPRQTLQYRLKQLQIHDLGTK